MRMPQFKSWSPVRASRGFTLEEVIISMAIASMSIGGIVTGYLLSSQRAEWSGYALAAQSLAMQRVEQIRAAKWDPISYPPVDQVVAVNFPEVVKPLDVPLTDTNNPTATIRTTVSLVSSDPPLKSIQVDCIWSYWDRGPFTNTIVTLRSPDQ